MEEKKPEENGHLEKEGEDTGQTVTTYVVVPPDGGWGWVIVAASFLCSLVVDGIVFSFGVFLNEISAEFGVSKAQVTLAGSLMSGFYLIAGPFVSALANRYGFRVVAIAGSVIGCVAFILASVSTSIQFLCVSYGILGGIGFGMIYVPSVIACGFYFEKWRALATGIAVCGSGIGTIVMGPATTFLISNFGWRGTLLIQAGIILHCVVFGSLFRPLKPIHVSVPADSEDSEEETQMPLLQRIKMARDQMKEADSTISLDKEVGITAVQPSETGFLKVNNNASYPTAAEVLNSSRQSISKSRNSLHSNKTRSRVDLGEEPEKRLSVPIFTDILHKSEKKHSVDYETLKESPPSEALLEPPRKHSKTASTILCSDVRRDSISIRCRARTMSESSHRSNRSRRNTLCKIESGVRPLYRDDIFLQGSLHRLPQYTSKGSGLDYTMSVTRLPTWEDVKEEEDSKCTVCPEAVRRTLATMLDLSLLLSPTFMVFCVAGFITMMGLFIPFMYLADRAMVNGTEQTKAVLLISAIGITNTLGRIVCGAITSLPKVNALFINNIALTIGGIATMFSGYSASYSFQFTYAIIFGFSIACFASLRSILIVELIGLDRLTNGFGVLLLFQGVASAIGSPIAGMFMELTGSYDASFYLAGGLLLLSGVMCYPLNILNKWEINWRNKKQKNSDVP